MHLYHTFDNRKQSVHAVIGAVVSSFGRQDKAPVVADADNVTAAVCFMSCEDDSVSRDVSETCTRDSIKGEMKHFHE